jgi:Tol biopolymer transport system component
MDVASKQEREVAKIFTDPPPLFGGDQIKWSPDNKWIAYLSYSPETRSYINAYVVPTAGGSAKPVSFLANSNSNTIAWSPDGTYLLFDTNQRTEDNSIARVDLTLRTPEIS